MWKRAVRVAAIVAVVVLGVSPAPAAAAPTVNVAAMFPGPHPTRLGWNYVTNAASNLYYEADGAAGTLLQANDPTGCHFDTFRWGTTLRYLATTNRCGGEDHVSLFEPGIQLAPASWNGAAWSRSGTSLVTTLRNGRIECTGRNTWTARVNGWVDVTPGERALHWSNEQTTVWETGPCAPWTTRWAEQMFYTSDGYRRSVGGNVNGGFSWDVWYVPGAGG